MSPSLAKCIFVIRCLLWSYMQKYKKKFLPGFQPCHIAVSDFAPLLFTYLKRYRDDKRIMILFTLFFDYCDIILFFAENYTFV